MQNFKHLKVSIGDREVGTLALYDNCANFEYSASWLQDGFSIGPLSMPLKKGVFTPNYSPFEGLHGIFSDSLPDGWGRLLLDRSLSAIGINPNKLNCLDRLAITGLNGMGALDYHPVKTINSEDKSQPFNGNFDQIAQECQRVFNDEYSQDLDKLFYLAGSSGGARPKILIKLDEEDWIVKFRSSLDPHDIGKMEYDYAVCAKHCGIDMPDFRLLPSEICSGYFAIKRFDRVLHKNSLTKKLENNKDNGNQNNYGVQRIHMASASALLETSHRIPNLDYTQLMKLTFLLTSSYLEKQKMFRLMCFNVFTHNRDDHSKNFTFLLDEKSNSWHLSPGYDLTYSNSLAGQHATTVDGNGVNPGIEDIMRVAHAADLDETWAHDSALSIQKTVNTQLEEYLAC